MWGFHGKHFKGILKLILCSYGCVLLFLSYFFPMKFQVRIPEKNRKFPFCRGFDKRKVSLFFHISFLFSKHINLFIIDSSANLYRNIVPKKNYMKSKKKILPRKKFNAFMNPNFSSILFFLFFFLFIL